MALIPLTFKADLGDENPKGNIRPEDLASFFAFAFADNIGVLNITGQDCSQFGGISIVGSTAQATFHKGYIVVLGRGIYLEEGTQVAFNLPSSGSVNGVLGVRINLAENGASEVTWFQKTANAQTDNLLVNTTSGIYEFALYNYTATPTSLEFTSKTNQIIKNIKESDFLTQAMTNNSKKVATTEFVHNVNTKFYPLNLTADVYAESKNIANYAFTGTGFLSVLADGKKYWCGNIVHKSNSASSNERFNDILAFGLKEIKLQGLTIKRVVDGGLFVFKPYHVQYDTSTVFAFDNVDGRGVNEVRYNVDFSAKDADFKDTPAMYAYNIIFEVE